VELRAAGAAHGRPDQGSDGRGHGDPRRLKLISKGLAERGINADEHLQKSRDMNAHDRHLGWRSTPIRAG
jgi:hypothetical protein